MLNSHKYHDVLKTTLELDMDTQRHGTIRQFTTVYILQVFELRTIIG
jgi:hypothetical protein